MNFFVVGTNHKHSPLSVREKIYYSRRQLREALGLLKKKKVFKSSVILSTCNRTEIYIATDCLALAKEEIINFLCQYHEIAKNKLIRHLYLYENQLAAKHLIRVACGLDSLIVGEVQISGQVRSAFNAACDFGFIDQELSKLFSWSLSVARKVHSQTKISEGKVSIGSVAVEFIKEKLKSLQGKKILLIGMGKVTKLLLSYLQDEEASILFISNRSYEKAKIFASQIGARVVHFDDLKNQINQADVVITATKSPCFIINQETLKRVNKQILIIDLALPRDVDPRVESLREVELFSLEDLKATIKKNSQRREKEAEKGELIIKRELRYLCQELIEPELDLARLP